MKTGVACRLVGRLPDASRKAEEYAALGMFQEAAETAATVRVFLQVATWQIAPIMQTCISASFCCLNQMLFAATATWG